MTVDYARPAGGVDPSSQAEATSPQRARAPQPGAGVLSDLVHYILHRPAQRTLVAADSNEQRKELERRILQRLGIDVAPYAVLNLHRIGVEAPVPSVFEELQTWDITETCWPRHLAALERVDGRVACVRAYPLGRRESLFGVPNGFLGLDFIPLFQLDLIALRDSPSPLDADDTRFLLYACSGGYPIGVFGVLVRSSIASLGEREQSQVFFLVSFDFWGRKHSRRVRLVRPVWERIHNRATGNILNRFKALCEARFQQRTDGRPAPG